MRTLTKFHAFVQYMLMHEIGQPDAIARNYALDHDRSKKPLKANIKCDFVRLGLNRLGYVSNREPTYNALMELQAHLNNHQYYPSLTAITQRVAEWYNYDRLLTKEIRQWPLNSQLSR